MMAKSIKEWQKVAIKDTLPLSRSTDAKIYENYENVSKKI
jgi:hypothetical protein